MVYDPSCSRYFHPFGRAIVTVNKTLARTRETAAHVPLLTFECGVHSAIRNPCLIWNALPGVWPERAGGLP
jgi:hypothetical protein